MTRSITPKTNGWNLNMMVSKRNLLLQRSTSRWTMLVGMYALLLSYVERIWQGTFPGTSHSSCFQQKSLPFARSLPTFSLHATSPGHYPYGVFPKWWHPTTTGLPTKNDHFGVFWGYHHFRKPPYLPLSSLGRRDTSDATSSDVPTSTRTSLGSVDS